MKLLNAGQIQEWDAYTIEQEGIASIDLMERAAQRCTDWLVETKLSELPIKIFCGKGNNGGDGLAIARQLISIGAYPSVYIIEFGAKGTSDFQENLKRLHQLTTDIHFIQSEEFFPVINSNDIIIDALFGSGLNRPLENLYAALVNYLNNIGVTTVAIDVPSGMFLEASSVGCPVIKADYTLTFQLLKLCFLVAENAENFGEVHVLDIGLDKRFMSSAKSIISLVTGKDISGIYKPRKNFSHKGTYGHALLVAGEKGKMGAAVLAAKACLRTGVGLLTCSVPAGGLDIMQTSVSEAMALLREEETKFSKYECVGIGPGLGTADVAVATFKQAIESFSKPMVIDADALNILAANNEWLNEIPENSVLTPHPKEFDRLFGRCINDFERLNKAIQLSKQYKVIILLKGHYTLVAADGTGFYNTTGNAGMATGGSGDVLTGIITALIAQNYPPVNAAILGAYIHGLAGDLALSEQSLESLLPTDIIKFLGKAFKEINSQE